MNGRPPSSPLDQALARAAAAAKAAPPPQQHVDPREMFARYFGLNVPTAQALMLRAVACMCGRCQGVGVQLEARLHFPIVGPPEVIVRPDAGAPAPEAAPPAPAEPSP
jgi:hypothetical protein